MKFKNIKTGEIFEISHEMFNDFYGSSHCKEENCIECPVSVNNNNKELGCDFFAKTYPQEFAKLAGYEVIETNEKQSKEENEYDNSINFLDCVARFWSSYLIKEITAEDVSKMIKFYELCKQMKGD